MRAELSSEQQQLFDTACALARALGPSSVAGLPPGGDADEGWRQLLDAGLLGLHLSPDLGGGGGGVLELSLCAEALARHLVPVPFIGATLAIDALALAGAGGVATLDDTLAGRLRPVAATGGGRAIDSFGADTVVRIDQGAVSLHPTGSSTPSADRSRAAVAALPATTAIGSLDRAAGDRLETLALVLLAADLVGSGTGALDLAVAHTRERQQFGVAIGSFQALKHLAADAHVDLVAARALVRAAAWRLDVADADALAVARRAKAVAAEAGRGACETACQLLGGIGHTWEHLASAHLRRALVTRALLGHELVQYERLAERPLAGTPDGIAGDDGFDLRDDPAEAGIRVELQTWLAGHPPPLVPDDPDQRAAVLHDWHRTLSRDGWAAVSMPADAGGRELPVTCAAIVNHELAAAGAPSPPPIGHLAHALARYGDDEQRRVHLAGMLDGTVRWCQGFSEPEAGSDLAGLRTRARLDGDRWTIDGRKIWTSEAAWSDWCLLLCRTEPDEPRHRGLSVLLVPLHTPGVDVTPITTAWGSNEFAEVSFSGAEVPAEHLLGQRGQGWEIAMALLEVERGPADVGWIARFRSTTDALLQRAPGHASARAAAWLEALEATVATTLTRRRAGVDQPSEGSVDKLLMTKVDQLVHGLALDAHGVEDAEALTAYLWSRAAGIFGGTSQIQRNIVSERLLGMPR